jgi:beta-glucosidase
MTWPRSLAQEPINVGDRNYNPLFPYGWGLRTG